MDELTILALRIASLEEKLMKQLFSRILHMEDKIMTQIEMLQAAIAAEDTVIGSAIILINGIAARISAAGTDEVALARLVIDVQSNAAALASCVSANQPAPAPVEAPAPAPAPADAPVDAAPAPAPAADTPAQ